MVCIQARYLSSPLRQSLLAMSVPPCLRQGMVSADQTLYLPAPTAPRVVSLTQVMSKLEVYLL